MSKILSLSYKIISYISRVYVLTSPFDICASLCMPVCFFTSLSVCMCLCAWPPVCQPANTLACDMDFDKTDYEGGCCKYEEDTHTCTHKCTHILYTYTTQFIIIPLRFPAYLHQTMFCKFISHCVHFLFFANINQSSFTFKILVSFGLEGRQYTVRMYKFE